MIEALEIHDGPVVLGLEDFESVYAKDQPEYRPLRTLVARTAQRHVMSRWTPTPEQRKAIAAGADIYLTVLTFGRSLQPLSLFVGDEADFDPIETATAFNLTTQEIPGVQA